MCRSDVKRSVEKTHIRENTASFRGDRFKESSDDCDVKQALVAQRSKCVSGFFRSRISLPDS